MPRPQEGCSLDSELLHFDHPWRPNQRGTSAASSPLLVLFRLFPPTDQRRQSAIGLSLVTFFGIKKNIAVQACCGHLPLCSTSPRTLRFRLLLLLSGPWDLSGGIRRIPLLFSHCQNHLLSTFANASSQSFIRHSSMACFACSVPPRHIANAFAHSFLLPHNNLAPSSSFFRICTLHFDGLVIFVEKSSTPLCTSNHLLHLSLMHLLHLSFSSFSFMYFSHSYHFCKYLHILCGSLLSQSPSQATPRPTIGSWHPCFLLINFLDQIFHDGLSLLLLYLLLYC